MRCLLQSTPIPFGARQKVNRITPGRAFPARGDFLDESLLSAWGVTAFVAGE